MNLTRHALILAAACSAAALSVGNIAQAAFTTQTVIVPVTYNADTVQTYEFDVAGHDASFGPLQSFSNNESFDLGAPGNGTIDWTLTNTGGSPQTGKRVQVAVNHNVKFKSSGVLVTGGSSYDYSPNITLNPGQSYTYTFGPFTSGSGSNNNSSLNSDLSTAGNITLQLQTGLSAAGYPGPTTLDVTNVVGQISGEYILSLSYKYEANSAPASTPISVGSSATNSFNGSGVDWYELDYSSGELTIDTLGSEVDVDGDNDTMLGLYSSLGNLIDFNDDGAAPGFTGDSEYLSQLVFPDGQLSAGTYYIAVSGYGIDFEADTTNFNADPSFADYATGPYRLNVNNAVPEPASLVLLGLGLAIVAMRRRAVDPVS